MLKKGAMEVTVAVDKHFEVPLGVGYGNQLRNGNRKVKNHRVGNNRKNGYSNGKQFETYIIGNLFGSLRT